jgi:glycine cleavage system transcriptional repressor
MNEHWYMLTLIGEDKPGIVAAVTQVLYDQGFNLGETSMLRLGGNFTIMMMVNGSADEDTVRGQLTPVIEAQGMCLHVDPIEARLHDHLLPNIQVTVSGADRAGIVAQVTAALAQAGFNILDLESDVAGTAAQPVYIMQIAGIADVAVEAIDRSMKALREQGVDINVTAIDTYIG